MKLVTAYQAFSPADAQLVRSRLEAAGFHPIVTGENAAFSMEGYAMSIGGILVQVGEHEAAEASAFLHDSQPANDDSESK